VWFSFRVVKEKEKRKRGPFLGFDKNLPDSGMLITC
jgi:hypothetical protein